MSASHKYPSENLNVVIKLPGVNSSSSLHAQTGARNPGVRVKGCDLALKGHQGYPKLFLPHDVSEFHMTDEHVNVFWCSSNVQWHRSEVTCRLSRSEPAWSPFLLEKDCWALSPYRQCGQEEELPHLAQRPQFYEFWLKMDSNSIFARIFLWVLTVTWDFVFATSASKLRSISLTSLEDIYRKYRTIMLQSWSDPPLSCAASRVRYTIFQLFIILRPVTYWG